MARGLRQGARVIASHGKKGKDLPTATIGCRPNTSCVTPITVELAGSCDSARGVTTSTFTHHISNVFKLE
jgi:hypothetical protein